MMGSLTERFIFFHCVNKAAFFESDWWDFFPISFLKYNVESPTWLKFYKCPFFDFCRYFFKKRSNEFESEVVFEEISNDDEVLPLWDGKIVAKVDKMD